MVFCCVISLGFVILSVSPFVGGIIVEPLPKWLDSKLRFLKNSIELCFSYRTVSFFSQCRNVYSKKKKKRKYLCALMCAVWGPAPHLWQPMHALKWVLHKAREETLYRTMFKFVLFFLSLFFVTFFITAISCWNRSLFQLLFLSEGDRLLGTSSAASGNRATVWAEFTNKDPCK